MASINPLGLPEIWMQVSEYLLHNDIVQCLRVCKSWHGLILPRIWSKVIIDNTNSSAHSEAPGSRKGQKNALEGDPSGLISLNPTLVHLRLHRLDGYLVARFWNTVAELPHLKSLRICGVTMLKKDDVEAFWSVCTKIERLHINASSFAAYDCKPTDLTFPKTRFLELHLVNYMGITDLLDLILRFRQLEELRWYSNFKEKSLNRFVHAITQRSWPNLQKLSLNCNINDEEMAPILGGMQRITNLDLSYNYFGSLSFNALSRHFNTLVELNVQESSETGSDMMQKFMCSCPHLETLKGAYIKAKHIVNGDPWICLSLKTLALCFVFEVGKDLNSQVIDRLATLVRLEHLDFGSRARYITEFRYLLDLRMEEGLPALASLKEIKCINLNCTKQGIGMVEIRWMLKNWRRLVAVYGGLNETKHVKDALVSILRAHKIKTG
ncbi:hypothetical protein BGZ46_002621 [Entomortierella lignicola]|nr:hypothetical protein BGZ46_002621 [Entomortierella lignicola]